MTNWETIWPATRGTALKPTDNTTVGLKRSELAMLIRKHLMRRLTVDSGIYLRKTKCSPEECPINYFLYCKWDLAYCGECGEWMNMNA